MSSLIFKEILFRVESVAMKSLKFFIFIFFIQFCRLSIFAAVIVEIQSRNFWFRRFSQMKFFRSYFPEILGKKIRKFFEKILKWIFFSLGVFFFFENSANHRIQRFGKCSLEKKMGQAKFTSFFKNLSK